MKVFRFMVATAVVAALMLSFASVTLAQMDAQKVGEQPASEAQKSFDTMKTLAGTWEGKVTTVPQMGDAENAPVQITMRITSRGNALVHEMKAAGTPEDPSKYDHPVTMIYLQGDHVELVHYCDAGNRPRMTGKASADGKTVEFEFVDLTGPTDHGHMNHAVFTMMDANHHTEDWTYMMPGDKPMHAHFDLQRAK
jgi:hypothetical protein